jgi:hypothetical protein
MSLRQRILEFCSSTGATPATSLRSLLKKSGPSGDLLIPDRVSFQNTEVLSQVLSVFNYLRPRDNYTLRYFLRHLDPAVTSIETALSVVEQASQAGQVDEAFVGMMFAKILKEFSLMSITSVDLARMLRIIQSHRFRHLGLIESICTRLLQETDISRKFGTIRILSELDLLESRHLLGFPDPCSLSQSVDYMWALLLQEQKLGSDFDFARKMSVCLVTVAKIDSENHYQNTSIMNKLRTIRNAVYFLHRDTIYDQLSDPLKSWLSCTDLDADQCSRSLVETRRPCRQIKQISDVLMSENVSHSVNTKVGAYKVDILERDRKIVWEFDSRDRFYTDHNQKTQASYYALKSRVLKAMGYQVIHIPYWQWDKMRNAKLQKDYCRTSRFLALSDLREKNVLHADPRKFTLSEISTTSAAIGGFHNEEIYRKQQPKQAWVWNKPSLPLRVAI